MASKPAGFHIKVVPVPQRQYPWLVSLDQQAKEMVASITRHVDGVEMAAPVYEFACGFCGAKWTERDHSYNGGCCEQDEAAEAARLSPPPAPEGTDGK